MGASSGDEALAAPSPARARHASFVDVADDTDAEAVAVAEAGVADTECELFVPEPPEPTEAPRPKLRHRLGRRPVESQSVWLAVVGAVLTGGFVALHLWAPDYECFVAWTVGSAFLFAAASVHALSQYLRESRLDEQFALRSHKAAAARRKSSAAPLNQSTRHQRRRSTRI